MKPIRVLIADDHVLVREALCQLLQTQTDMEVVGQAGDGLEAFKLARTFHPDVLVIDLSMPRMSGLESLPMIRDAAPGTRVVVLSMYDKEEYVEQALNAGASGYVVKSQSGEALLDAIRTVYRGEQFFSPKIAGYAAAAKDLPPKNQQATEGYSLLSEREKQVFLLIAEGNTSPQIAQVLCITLKTVEKHRASIIRKLGISNPVDMMKYAIRIGVIVPDFWTDQPR